MSTLAANHAPAPHSRLLERFTAVRNTTLALCHPLSPEDAQVQVQPFTSPTKWHLAHTTWFFETLALRPFEPGFQPFDERFPPLFNSYYHTLGDRRPRDCRGLLTRPSLDEVLRYRRSVDSRLAALLRRAPQEHAGELERIVELGLHHEQQHQELILTDIKLLLSTSPLRPAYQDTASPLAQAEPCPARWRACKGGLVRSGWDGPGFAYDNESPAHRVYLEPFELADRLVTNAEYQEFVDDGGYDTPTLWLDDGWSRRRAEAWRGPLYWTDDPRPSEFTLSGLRPREPHAPVAHISFFEADAYARWAGARLPTEHEWEHAAQDALPTDGNFLESGRLHPLPAAGDGLRQLFGDLWEWTRSTHEPYPGYRPPQGAYAEYNGKFMCGSFILRGGSCATSRTHIRRTYRNFFEPGARWQFSGIRLARDLT